VKAIHVTRPGTWAVALLAAILVPPLLANDYQLRLIVVVGIYTLLTMGLNFMLGYAGLLSLAQVGFFAIGAYFTAILTVDHHWSFWLALPVGVVACALVAIIRDLRPHVVVTYDPDGGYGHPDHIHAHEVTTAAVAASAGTEFPGDPWSVPKLYWAVTSKSAMAAGLQAIEDVPAGWRRVAIDDLSFGYPDHEIDAVIDATDQLPAKVAALRAHATQIMVAPDDRACALSNNMALPIGAAEYYILAAGDPGDRDDRGRESDLLAGLNLG